MAGFDPISLALDLGGKLIDRIWPDPTEAAKAKLELVKMQQSGELAQLAANTDLAKAQTATNTAEAASSSIFVSGWRPFIGWTCGSGLGFQFVVAPVATWVSSLAGYPVTFPALNAELLVTLLFGMLGLGAYRTVEKIKGVS